MLHAIASKIPAPIKDAIKEHLYPPMLPEGETAPEWHLQAWDGSWHRMGSRWCILVFYPADDTPGCTAQLQEFQAHYDRLKELGCEVFGLNPAEAPSHEAFAKKAGITFPLLTDRGGAVARMFRATLPSIGKPHIIRTVYLVNPDRKIRLANRGTPAVEAIVRSIEALQQATREGR